MLEILRRIVQEVHAAANLDEALAIIVRRVKEAMEIDACSVFFADIAADQYVLMATDGLHPSSVGRVRLNRDEGLVGLVGERREPVNLANAAQHPRYRYFAETGEERYHAFLGVPIIHYRQVLGVLIVQQREERLFTKDEEALLVTIAAQLAGAISDGARGGGISRLMIGRTQPSGFIRGMPGAPGFAVGTVVLASPFTNLASVPDRPCQDTKSEEAAFRTAVAAVQEELRWSGERLAGLLPAEARAIFDVYRLLLDNDRLITDTIERIHTGNWAPGALRDTIGEYARIFEQMEEPYLRARAEDIRAIGHRILVHLQAGLHKPRTYPQRCILLGEEIGAASIAEIPVDRLAGIVCMRGSVLSHTAILARALGIPAVMGVGDLPIKRLENATIVVDGYQGHIFIQPTAAILDEFQQLVGAEEELVSGLESLRSLPAETPDGVRIPLHTNCGLPADIESSLERGAEGIGLFRTEFAFMVRESFPSEDEQYQLYRRVLETFAPKPVTVRTLDIGGDKGLPYFPIVEDNALLGWRGIRVGLDHPEIFLTQLRAILRANAGLNNLYLAFPMISRLKELDEAKQLLERAYGDLYEAGIEAAKPLLGAVIEVPASVYQIATLAQRVDFISIGTNDLTQFLLAVDRSNARVAKLYDCLHPAVIRAIHDVVREVHQFGKPVGVCGEMASDPAGAILLLGMGVDTLSVASPRLSRIKWVIRSFTQRQALQLLNDALGKEDSSEVRELLNESLKQAGLGALISGRE